MPDAAVGSDPLAATGVVLRELLEGFLPARSQRAIRTAFDALERVEPEPEDHVDAADLSITSRRPGVDIATTDADSWHAARHVPLQMWSA